MSDVIRIAESDRFDRFRLIAWWDQPRLRAARVLVVGAGALGNEIVKNLALLGVGNVLVADMDTIEGSNLSRSVLFRAADCGRHKAAVAAATAKQIYPDMRAQPFIGNVVYDLGLGVFRWADVIIGGLDNREARVAINRAAARAGRSWIDGAIERLDGVARVFTPASGPCYECTMSDVDWKMLDARRSCALLSRAEMMEGKVPTTPTTSSVIAGIQCQEAVKLLHGMDVMSGAGFVFNGVTHESYQVRYKRLPDCPSHDADAPVEVMPGRSDETSIRDMLEHVRRDLGPDAVLEFNQDLLSSLECATCGTREPLLASLGKVTEAQGRCPRCGEHRIPHTFHTVDGSESFLDRSIREIGVPPWDVLAGRRGMEQRFYEFRADSADVLGELASPAEIGTTQP
ncbi:MAG: sulfur-carrier protein adenylyltransferase/sulfurtransferase [Phycisphaerales bacterium]|nr:sulfur-carrier protein adenylyltransferase/sulfurtransferase [Phycisphaerales bacterium]